MLYDSKAVAAVRRFFSSMCRRSTRTFATRQSPTSKGTKRVCVVCHLSGLKVARMKNTQLYDHVRTHRVINAQTLLFEIPSPPHSVKIFPNGFTTCQFTIQKEKS